MNYHSLALHQREWLRLRVKAWATRSNKSVQTVSQDFCLLKQKMATQTIFVEISFKKTEGHCQERYFSLILD